ncbi:hypothetical protein V3C99_019197 [Haemonchus contortus]
MLHPHHSLRLPPVMLASNVHLPRLFQHRSMEVYGRDKLGSLEFDQVVSKCPGLLFDVNHSREFLTRVFGVYHSLLELGMLRPCILLKLGTLQAGLHSSYIYPLMFAPCFDHHEKLMNLVRV